MATMSFGKLAKTEALLPSVHEPELPRVYVDTAFPSTSGYSTLAVPGGGDLQSAINQASCSPNGTILRLAAGATFSGSFTLPAKQCAAGQWIIIRTDTADANLPGPEIRINPSYSPILAKILSHNAGPAIKTANGASYYWFMGVEIGVTDDTPMNYGVFAVGSQPPSLEALPHHIVLDRCYIHGNAQGAAKRGLQMNGAYLAAINSYFENFHVVGQDAQAIASWMSPGPLKIVNNFLEGSGENVLFGGANPIIPGIIPSDIEIRRNHFFKPLSWKIGAPTFAGTPWAVKNILEFKNARRVLVEGNILENNWVHGQAGTAVVLTPRGEHGHCPWCTVEDVTFRYNILMHAGGGFDIGPEDGAGGPSQPTQRLNIHDNLIIDINGKGWGSPMHTAAGRLYEVLNGCRTCKTLPPHDIIINHNTAFQSGNFLTVGDARDNPIANLIFTNNIQPHNQYGFGGSGVAPGNAVASTFLITSAVTRNIIEGLPPSINEGQYPPGNFFPSDWGAVEFADFEKGDYRLKPSSRYHHAGTDGKDIGADIDQVMAATAGVN